MAPNFRENIFMNFGNALCITRIIALKILVLYRCSPASYKNISSQCQRAPTSPMDNFPVATSSYNYS